MGCCVVELARQLGMFRSRVSCLLSTDFQAYLVGRVTVSDDPVSSHDHTVDVVVLEQAPEHGVASPSAETLIYPIQLTNHS